MRLRLLTFAGLLSGAAVLAACNAGDKPKASTPVATSSPAGATSPTTATPQVPTVHADGVRRVTTTELRDLMAKNQAVVVDVRNDASFKQGHLPGARLIPVADVLQKADELPKDKLIVTYCS